MTEKHDPGELERLWRLHVTPLTRYATRLLGDWSQAESVVQEAFIRWMDAGAIVPAENVRAWMYRVVRNKSFDLLRHENRGVSLDNSEKGEPVDRREGPARQVIQKEEQAMLLEEITHLPERQQEALRLKFQEGLTYREIAEATDQTSSTVGWLLHKALSTLRQKMNQPTAAQ